MSMEDSFVSISISEKVIKRARDMYWSDISIVDIANELNIEINQLGRLIFGPDRSGYDPNCWYQLKRQQPEGLSGTFTRYKKVKSYLLSKAEERLSRIIIRTAEEMDESGVPLDLDGLTKVVGVYEKLDKIGRLERGEPTDIVDGPTGFTLRDIVNNSEIQQDIVEAEVINKENTDVKEKEPSEESTEASGSDGSSDGESGSSDGKSRASGDSRARNPIRTPVRFSFGD